MSDPEVRKKISDARWDHFKHLNDKQAWPWWRKLIHRFENCPICRPEKLSKPRWSARKGRWLSNIQVCPFSYRRS